MLGVNSNLNALLSNLKGKSVSTEKTRYNSLNSSFKSPIKPNSSNFSNLGLVDAYNFLVESNTKRKYSYFSPNNSKTLNNNNKEISNTYVKKNNSLYSNPRIKTTDNEFKGRNDFANLH